MLGWECPATAAEGEHGPVFEGEAGHLADAGAAVGVLAGSVHHLGGFDLVVAGGTASAERRTVSARLRTLCCRCDIDTYALAALAGFDFIFFFFFRANFTRDTRVLNPLGLVRRGLIARTFLGR